MNLKFKTGNALGEYAFVGALVGVAAIGGLTVLGHSLLDQLQGVKSDMQMNIADARNAQTKAGAMKMRAAAVQEEALQAETQKLAGLEARTLASNLAAETNDRQETVQTAGGNGSEITRANVRKIEQIAAEYAAMPNPEPKISQYLTDLARAGHVVADTQYGLETESAKAGYAMNQAASKNNWVTGDQLLALKTAKKYVDKWSEYYRDNGKGYDVPSPEALAVIKQAYGQMYGSGLQYAQYGNAVNSSTTNGSGNIDGNFAKRKGLDNSFLKTNPQSAITQGNSNTVCDQGGKNCTQKGFN